MRSIEPSKLKLHNLRCTYNTTCLFFRNGCVCCGSSVLLSHIPLQSLCRISLILLDPFAISDPVLDRRRFLLLHISIPEERPKFRPGDSRCGGLHYLNHSNGVISHQNPPHNNTFRKFELHGV